MSAIDDFREHIAARSDELNVAWDAEHVVELFQAAQHGGAEAVEQLAVELADEYEDDPDEYDDEIEPEYEDPYDDEYPDDDFAEDDDYAEVDGGTARLIRDAGADVARIQERIGRPLLASEEEALTHAAVEQAGRYDGFTEHSLAEQAGVKALADMTDEEKEQWQVARMREQLGDDPSGLPAVRNQYDISDDQEFVEYAQHRMAGTEFEDAEAEYE
jgi:hypothetical protein